MLACAGFITIFSTTDVEFWDCDTTWGIQRNLCSSSQTDNIRVISWSIDGPLIRQFQLGFTHTWALNFSITSSSHHRGLRRGDVTSKLESKIPSLWCKTLIGCWEECTLRFAIKNTLFSLLLLFSFKLRLINLIKCLKSIHGLKLFHLLGLLIPHEVFPLILIDRLDDFWLKVSIIFLFRPQNEFLLLNELVLIVFVNFKKLFVHNLLRRSKILSFVVVELYQQRVQVLSFEINLKSVPLAMQTVVMEELGLVGIILLWVCHCHWHHRGTNRALHQPLTLVFLGLRFLYGQNIVAVFAVKVLDLFLEAKPAKALLAFEAAVHLFLNKLPVAPALVVDIWRSEFGKSIHIY